MSNCYAKIVFVRHWRTFGLVTVAHKTGARLYIVLILFFEFGAETEMIFLKLNTLRNRGLFVRSRQVFLVAAYSRNSSNSKSPYKIVTAKIKSEWENSFVIQIFFCVFIIGIDLINFIEDTSDQSVPHENGLNWELFGPRNNRFFLGKGSIGPAYLNSKSTIGTDGLELEQLIDFDNNDKNKLHITTQKCPMLIRKNLHELFPAPEVLTENDKLTLITLSQAAVSSDHEKAAINFVLAAREICTRLRMHGYWSDFLNPMSGRPFHSYHQKSLYKLNDERFRGLCIKFEEVKAEGANENCLVICEDKSKFSGSVFTNIPPSLDLIKELILD